MTQFYILHKTNIKFFLKLTVNKFFRNKNRIAYMPPQISKRTRIIGIVALILFVTSLALLYTEVNLPYSHAESLVGASKIVLNPQETKNLTYTVTSSDIALIFTYNSSAPIIVKVPSNFSLLTSIKNGKAYEYFPSKPTTVSVSFTNNESVPITVYYSFSNAPSPLLTFIPFLLLFIAIIMAIVVGISALVDLFRKKG